MPNLYSLCLISLIFLQAQFQMDDQKKNAKITFVTFKLTKHDDQKKKKNKLNINFTKS